MACAAFNALLFRHALVSRAAAPGEILRGAFELQDGEVTVVLQPWRGAHMWPDDVLGVDAQIAVMPGRSVGIPLAQGSRHALASPSGALAPYWLLGGVEASAEPARLVRPVVPASDGSGGMRLVPWARERPWREDEARLAELTRACANTADSPPRVTIDAAPEGWVVRFGRCDAQLPKDAMAGATPVLVGLGGPYGLTIDRLDTPVRVERSVNAPLVGITFIGAVSAVAGLGPLGALVGSGFAAALGAYREVAGVIFFGAVQVLAIIALLVRGTRAGLARSPRTVTAIAAVLVAIGATRRLWVSERTPSQAVPSGRCAVTGYSTVEGETLRRRADSAGAIVGAECTACGGSAEVRPKSGGTFAWVRDTMCGDGAAAQVVFLGGGNDDFFWGRARAEVLSRLIQIIVYSFQPPTFQQWTGLRAAAEHGSLAAIDQQAAAFRGAAECVRGAGGRMFVFHDFLVWDLPRGRSDARQAMLTRRRAEIEGAGGRFVDLLEATGERASITWFNDYIHLSQVGHRVAADLICSELSRR